MAFAPESQPSIAQGATLVPTISGPMIQAVVNDAENSFLDNTVQPLSMNTGGRLRVSMVVAPIPAYEELVMPMNLTDLNCWTLPGGCPYV